ncbi:MAG TPA: hypothetical protein VLZ12_03035 [Verrucomicrobiae bacterium]|nr:hypothetical protein [Verrucomicrobiae bacterium]
MNIDIRSSALRLGTAAGLLVGLMLTGSCLRPQQTGPPPQTPAPPEVGRYQVVVTSEGDRSATLFLVDTKEGSTWIYQRPQGNVLPNGFWSDVPRVTYPPMFWENAFRQIGQQGAPPSGAPPAPPSQ